MEVMFTKGLTQYQNNYQRISNFQKVPKVPKKESVREILKHGIKESISDKEEDDHAQSSELRTKLPSKKGQNIQDMESSHGQRIPKKYRSASSNKKGCFEDDCFNNKKRGFDDDCFNDALEEDEEMMFLLKASSRKRFRNSDGVMTERNSEDEREKNYEFRNSNMCTGSKERCSPINVKVISFLYSFSLVDLFLSSYFNSIEGISSLKKKKFIYFKLFIIIASYRVMKIT